MHKIVPCSWMIIKQWCKMGNKDTFIVMYTNLLLTLLLIAWQSSYMNLCYSGMLEQLSLLLSEHCHLLVAVTAFLCKLVFECLLISYSPPEATLKLELHRVQNARSFPNELDCNQWCDFFPLVLEFTIVFLFLWCRRRSTRARILPSLCWLRHRYKMPEPNLT